MIEFNEDLIVNLSKMTAQITIFPFWKQGIFNLSRPSGFLICELALVHETSNVQKFWSSTPHRASCKNQ